ncbi:CHAT domain-containing protein [Peribacillus simplex]|uniref:CHAT domain-containing protein n=1 Tax=Peribacillus simplex TaxID=1478 RepID=UPI0010BF2FCD|nr:CHAT domain-containing protein [Peribacillus simplex]TKH01454.1 CHAT domain-containing protein [Peribacillus simplex]
MIRERFLTAAETLKQAIYYAPNDVDKLTKLFNRIGVDHSQKNLLKMFRLCINIVQSIPDEKYYIHKDIVYDFSNALVELGKKHKRVTHYFDGISFNQDHFAFKKFLQFGDPHIFAIALYINLAVRLDDLGLPGEAFNAIVKSMDPWVIIYDKDTGKGDLQTKNIDLFDNFLIGTTLIGIEGNRTTLIGRAAAKFHNLSIVGHVNNDARDIFLKYKRYLKHGVDATYEDIRFYTSYLELIMGEKTKNKSFDEIINYLEKQFEIEKTRNSYENCFLIASVLAKALDSIDWAKKAVSTSPSKAYWAELLYMKAFIISRSDNPKVTNYRELLRSFLFQAGREHSDRMMQDLCKQKNSGFLNMMVSSCILNKEYQLAVELIYAWWVNKPGDTVLQSPEGKALIIAIPNFHPKGSHFLIYGKEKVHSLASKSSKKLSDILLIKDKVESSWTAILNEEETLIPKEDSRSYVELSSEYINTLSEFIGSNKLIELLSEIPEGTHFQYIELSWTNTPIPALLSNITQQTYSVSVDSVRLPEPKEVKKVLIWSDPDGSLPMSTFEVEAIKHILSCKKIDFELFEGTQCTKNLFLEKYSDPEFDIIWVISHGAFNSDNPPFSKLYVAENDPVTTWELQKYTPITTRRRHLILNACQSGAAGVRYNSMGFLGIGPSVTNEFQAVLGHLWYVDSLASAVLGTFTLKALLEGNSLALSLKQASKIMCAGNQAIEEGLLEISDSLHIVERVRNSMTKDLSLPFYSMSALVFG